MKIINEIVNYFIDKKRLKKCKRRKRSVLIDFFWYSDINDYYKIRVFINFIFGLIICIALYYMTWKRLNFLEFNVYTSNLFQVFIIGGASYAFAKNPIFRCAIICVCLGALGRTGQGLFTVFILERLSDGPIDNLIHNFQLSSQIVICHLELQSRITTQRITLAAGPIEALLEKHLGKSVTIGKKIIHTLKALIEPFTDDLKTSSEEDDKMAAVIDNAQALSDRQLLVEGGGTIVENTTVSPNLTDSQSHLQTGPIWTRYKSTLARAVSRRLLHRCEEMFSGVVKNCHERLENIQPGEISSLSNKYCESGSKRESDNPLSSDLDGQLESIQNLHFQAIEEPANENIRALDEIKNEIKADVHTFKIVLNTFKDFLTAVLVLLLYFIFRDALKMIRNYLSDLNYRNTFLTTEFWYMDLKRQLKERENFGGSEYFDKDRMKQFGVKKTYDFPMFNELIGSWTPLLRWIVLCFIVLTIVALDYYYYRVLMLVIEFGSFEDVNTKNEGTHTLEIKVEGEGPITEMIKDILNFNFTQTMQKDFTNEMCLTMARPPDWTGLLLYLSVPLLIMLLIQIFFNFIIGRIILLYIISFIFKKRARVRVRYLYQKLLNQREKDKFEAQQIIKKMNNFL